MPLRSTGYYAARIVLFLAAGTGVAGCRRRTPGTLDQSTPEAAVRSTIQAIEDRNADRLKNCFVTQTAPEKAYARAMGRLIEASRTVQAKLADRFGSEEARNALGAGGPSGEDFKRFEEGRKEINGPEAKLTDSLGHVLQLRSEGTAWKIVPEGPAGATVDLGRSIVALDRLSGVLTAINGELAADAYQQRYPTADDVKAEILRREAAALAVKGPE